MPTDFNGYKPSGTYNFFPSNLELIAQAFSRCRIKRTMIEAPHLQDAVTELNLFLAAFNTAGPNLAQVDLQQIPLVTGQQAYPETALGTVMVLDVFLTYSGGGTTLNQYMYPISRTEFSAIPLPSLAGRPNQYWYDRLQTGVFQLYPVPDGNGPYTLNYYRFRQVQDSILGAGTTPEVPNRAIDAVTAGLAYRLARIYAPDLEKDRKADAAEAWAIYAKQDTEDVALYLTPALSHYYRT